MASPAVERRAFLEMTTFVRAGDSTTLLRDITDR